MMDMSRENLFILLENAVNDGNPVQLRDFLCNSADEQYLDCVLNKIGDNIKEVLSFSLDSQHKIENILSIIVDLSEIAEFGTEKSECLTRSLLSIAVDQNCSIGNLKEVLGMLKTFLANESIMQWCSSDESLFVPLKMLGVKLPLIGDYECQTLLLETLWLISVADRNFWADMWFSNEKIRSMFLNLNADQFLLDCRKFLNFINRNEENKRTFAFVASSVSLGSISLRKPYGSDFWIDFNLDSQSISFFYSSLDLENEDTWSTIIISSEVVEGYYIQKSITTKELYITLKCPCSQLLPEETLVAELESHTIKMTFWGFLDIHKYIERVFQISYSQSQERVPDLKQVKQKRRASESINLVCSSDCQERGSDSKRRRASEPTELIYSSYPQESQRRWKASDSTELVTMLASQKGDSNNIDCEVNVPDYGRVKRIYKHCKKVSDGFVDSEEFGQDVCLVNDYEEEETINSQNVSYDMNGRKKVNSVCNKKFSDKIGSEIEHRVESYVNDNEHVDTRNNLSNTMRKNTLGVETYTSHKSLLEDYNGETNVNEGYEGNQVENIVEGINPETKNCVDGYSQSKPKSSPSSQLLAAPNISQKKSSQVSFDGCSQSTPKRSQSSQLLTAPNISQQKSSQVSFDGCSQSTSKRNKNLHLFPVCKEINLLQSVSDVDDESAISPTPLSKGKIILPNKLTDQSSKQNKHMKEQDTNQTPIVTESISIKTTGLSSRMSLRNRENVTECNRSINMSLNGYHKKKRLYNINKDPVYDVPPSKKRSNENITHSAVNISLHPEENLCINKTKHKENELSSPEKKLSKVPSTKVTNSNINNDAVLISENTETETRTQSPGIMEDTKGVQQRQTVSPEKFLSSAFATEEKKKDLEIELETEDNQVLIDMECATNLSSPKQMKKYRRAAVTARKRNKLILNQKGSETSFEGSQLTNQQNKGEEISDKIEEDETTPKTTKRSKSARTSDVGTGRLVGDEYEFHTPPPLKKRKPRGRSPFVTDTETGSSETSWFTKFRLFDTPKKGHSNRKKIKEAKYQKKYGKPKLTRTKNKTKAKLKFSQRSKSSNSETKSKSAFSELENFNLVIENDKSYKSVPVNNLAGYYHASESDRNVRQSSIEEDINQDYPFEELDVHNENVKSIEVVGDDDLSENLAPNAFLKSTVKTKDKTFLPSTSAETSDMRIKPNSFSQNKKEPIKSKRRHTDSTVKPDPKRSKLSVEDLLCIDLDTITHSEDQFQKSKHEFHNRSKKNMNNSIAKSHSILNVTPSDVSLNLPISFETVIKGSSFEIKGNKSISHRWISPQKFLEIQYEDPILECKNSLTAESLSSYNDEKTGKKHHLEHYLKSLSSASSKPEDLGFIDDIDIAPIVDKSKSKHSKEMLTRGQALEHFISVKCTMEEQLRGRHQKQSSEKNYTVLKECNVVDSALQSKPLLEQVEVESSERDVSNDDVFERPLQTSTPRKAHNKHKMAGENDFPVNSSVLHILSDEVNTLTHRLFLTLKKCMSDFREKMAALRERIVNTADKMIANESKFSEKDLLSLARNCRESRIHIKKHLKKLYSMGLEYFESELKLERRLANKHRKAILKYIGSLETAQSIAEKALEERFILKSGEFFKSFLKRMEVV